MSIFKKWGISTTAFMLLSLTVQPVFAEESQTTHAVANGTNTASSESSTGSSTTTDKNGQSAAQHATLVNHNNRWEYHTNGKIDTSFTGITDYYGTAYYVEKGLLKWDYTGLAHQEGDTWLYVNKGIVTSDFTGLVTYYGRQFYVENGRLNWQYTNLFLDRDKKWKYVKNGEVDFSFTGKVTYFTTDYYIEKGVLNWNYSGLVKTEEGKWVYVEKGIINYSQTQLVDYQQNKFYVANGEVDWSFTNLFNDNGKWYYVEYGRVNYQFTGLVDYFGTLYYVKNGEVDWSYVGLHQHTDGTWYLIEKGVIASHQTKLVSYQNNMYYVQNGKIDWSYTGLVNHEGTWYHVVSARLDRNFTGLTDYFGTTYYVENGLLNWGYTGLVQDGTIWKYVKNGIVTNDYTAVILFRGNLYYVYNGVIDWTFTGKVVFDGVHYTVTNNTVEWPAEGFVILSDVNNQNYSFTITLKPNMINDIKSVKSFVWSEANGQDDIVEHTVFKQKDGTYQSVVRFANYLFVEGRYYIDTYVTLNSGQEILVSKKEISLKLPSQRSKIAQEIQSLKQKYHELFDSVGGKRGMYVIAADGFENFVINPNSTNPAASTIKLFVMAATFNKAARGEFDFSWRYTVQASDIVTGSPITKDAVGTSFNMDQYIRFMMEKSDNAATNILIRHLGGVQATNEEIRRLGYTKTVLTRYMWDYAAINRGLDNYISAQEAGDLIKNIYNRQLVNDWSDIAMLDRLSRNYYAEWLTANIRGIAKTWDKPGGGVGTGTDNDIAVIQRNGRAYIVSTLNYFGAGHQKNAVIQFGEAVANILRN